LIRDLVRFGPVCAIAAFARVERRTSIGVAIVLAVGVVVLWTMAFAARESSTAALAFLWAWVAGVPAATAFVNFQARRRSRR
jgi:FtsH-binding integral membrane protein